MVVIGFRTSTPWWVESHIMFNLRPTIPDFIAVLVILPVFYFTYTYFVVSDYLARLCGFIFERTGQNLQLFFRQLPRQAVRGAGRGLHCAAAAIVVDLFSYTGDRQQSEILVDVASAVMGVAITAYYVGRSLLRLIVTLSWP